MDKCYLGSVRQRSKKRAGPARARLTLFTTLKRFYQITFKLSWIWRDSKPPVESDRSRSAEQVAPLLLKIVWLSSRGQEVRAVKHVEHFCPELNVEGFRNPRGCSCS